MVTVIESVAVPTLAARTGKRVCACGVCTEPYHIICEWTVVNHMPTFKSKYAHKKSARHATDPVHVAYVIREYGSLARQSAPRREGCERRERREVRCGTRVRSVRD